MELKVEYVSIMAQAQKLAGLAGLERFTGYVVQVAGVDPQVLDKVNRDQLIDEYGEITGIAAKVIVPDEEVAEIRMQRAQAQQAAQQVAMAREGAAAAKDLASAKTDENNALTGLIRQSQAGAVA
jgi:hypothetical protein